MRLLIAVSLSLLTCTSALAAECGGYLSRLSYTDPVTNQRITYYWNASNTLVGKTDTSGCQNIASTESIVLKTGGSFSFRPPKARGAFAGVHNAINTFKSLNPGFSLQSHEGLKFVDKHDPKCLVTHANRFFGLINKNSGESVLISERSQTTKVTSGSCSDDSASGVIFLANNPAGITYRLK